MFPVDGNTVTGVASGMYRSRGYSLPDATRPSLGLSSSSPAVKRRGSGDEKTDKTEEVVKGLNSFCDLLTIP